MRSHSKKLIYLILIIATFFLEANVTAKLAISMIVIMAAYSKQQRSKQLNGAILEKHQANRMLGVLLCGTFSLHLVDSSVRVIAELTLLIILMSWFLQSIRLNQKYMVKVLFYNLITGIVMLVVHVQLDIVGIHIHVINANATYVLPILLLKMLIELRLLIREFKALSSGIHQKIYDPNGNSWFASTFGIISHNLKTPLASVQGQCDILRLKLNMAGIEGFQNHFESIEQSLSATKGQLEQTISTFKTRMNLTNYPEPSMIILMDQLKKEFPGSITLEGSTPPLPLSANEFFALNLALQVVQDNALKYGEGPVTWRFDDYKICIRDKGTGFSEHILKTQGNEMQQTTKTGGVGLFYAKSILKTVGWTLDLSNEEGACVQLKKGHVTEQQMARIW